MSMNETMVRTPYFRHQKTGRTYAIVGFSILESNPNVTLVTYESQEDGLHWTRPASEFFDGRFIPEVDDAV